MKIFLDNPENVTYHHMLNRHLRCSQRSNVALPCKIAIVVLGPKDFPVMLKKAGSWIGTAKRYVSNIQNEVSNLEIDDEKINNEVKKETKKDE